MSEGRKSPKRKVGCLLLAVTPLLLAVMLYELLYYNPMRLTDRRQLTYALQNGLLTECDELLVRGGADDYWPDHRQWPPVIRELHPRRVSVFTREPKQVWIELWKNYREWETRSILGIWTDKGARGVSLIVYAATPTESPPERGNDQPLVPYNMRKVAERVYLNYPKRMEAEVLKHTDLVQRAE